MRRRAVARVRRDQPGRGGGRRRRHGGRPRWARRGRRQRGRGGAAAARGRQPRGDGAHAPGERDGRLQHASRRRPAHQPPGGYALPVASLAAAVHLPMLGAYSASKSAVEALGNTLRAELRHTGAKVGVAYFAELKTDMTSRGFGTEAASKVESRQAHASRPARGRDRRPRTGHRAALPPGRGALVCRRPAAGADGGPAIPRPGHPARPARGTRDGPLRGRAADHAAAGALALSAARDRPGRPQGRRPLHVGVEPCRRQGRRHRPAQSLPHARPPPQAVSRLAALRRPTDAGREAAPARDRAGHPARRPPALLPLRVRPPRAPRPPRRAGRRGHRTGGRGARGRRLVAARAYPAHGRRRGCTTTRTSTTPPGPRFAATWTSASRSSCACSWGTTRCSQR